MFESLVYVLCFLTSALCAWLLLASYRRRLQRLLLWSGLCFCLLALNSLLVFVDIVVLPTEIDLTSVRLATTLFALVVLLYGFVWEVD
ncbi:MAG TPA: DUF5985 family protein [Acetobacteraceae bacterium]|nr:DUF5985 family protein [Acetobacteraceae bacterium]